MVGQNGGNQQEGREERQKMKYMIMGTRNLMPMEPATAVAVFQAAKQWMEARLADGTHDLHYVDIETGAGFTITNASSHEEVMDGIYDYPPYPFFDWEVTPLCDWSHAYDKTIELFQKLGG
jgi:muconolactone delta-isomerase